MVAEGLEPSLDLSRPAQKPLVTAAVPCVTGEQWIAEAMYLIREQVEARKLEAERSAPSGAAGKKDEG